MREFLAEFLSTFVMMVSWWVGLGVCGGDRGSPFSPSLLLTPGSYHSFPCL